jgi:hypothetical protein
MKLSTLAIAIAIGGLSVSGAAISKGKGSNDVIDDDLSRRGAGSTSGSGHTVEGNCGGPDYQGSTGKLVIAQSGAGSTVEVEIEDAVPNTHFTIWTRIKGSSSYNPAGSPWTGGGATPLCSGTNFGVLNDNSPWNNAAGTTDQLCNSFYTDGSGTGTFKASVNFPVVGGAYPFQQSGGDSANGAGDAIPDVPTAIVDPRTGTGGPFMIRVVSHCTDNANHGLSPATREAWFQYP